MSRGRLVKGAMAALAIAAFVATASAQGFRRGNRFFEPLRSPTPESFDGSFNFCRIMFPHDRLLLRLRQRLGGRLPARRHQPVHPAVRAHQDAHQPPARRRAESSGDGSEQPGDVQLSLHHDDGARRARTSARPKRSHLREYLLKGGFLWADDFWGSYAWEHWAGELAKVLPPDEYPIADLPRDHPLFHAQFEVARVPQIPSIGFWGGPGGRRPSAAPTAPSRMRAASPTHTAG